MYFQAIDFQALQWKPHNKTLFLWGLFVINDNLPIDLVNLEMLHCIIYLNKLMVTFKTKTSFLEKS